ncbi:uncharacterized protein N7511_009614 [Penicillium nucicola]|uniref:uncharacterized protein n=1 Tax=Penicillium nucicola TaxID=1850975 RepID=UPI002544DD37|nr:uncharacterized protein N7511_009614 [Penicillium nucicola]KAJ5747918.1 hypothetical protein N7511_009614 [Penicillium nucicola]
MASGRSGGHLGELGRLPNELLWQILDHMILDDSKITHEGICGLWSLMRTNQANTELIKEGYLIGTRLERLKAEIGSVTLYIDIDTATDAIGHAPPDMVGGTPGEERDLLTSIIKADCVECYHGIRALVPEFSLMCHNEKGWSLFAVAVEANARKIIHRFMTSDPPADIARFLFNRPHPGSAWNMSNLGFTILYQDAYTFVALFRYLQATVPLITLKQIFESKLTDRIRRDLIQLMDPDLERMFEQGSIVIRRWGLIYY